MKHHTKNKGDLAVAKTMADLVSKGYDVFTSISEHLPFDLIAYKDNRTFRIQCKYSYYGGLDKKNYNLNDFDYYALYLPNLDKVLYPNISFKGLKVSSVVPNSATPFYWWEDFQEFTDTATKKNYKDFGGTIKFNVTDAVKADRKKRRKTEWPPEEELKELIWKLPLTKIAKQFKVSDVAVKNWVNFYNLETPPIGYWAKKKKTTQE